MAAFQRSIIIDAPAATVWEAALRPSTLRYVAWPLVSFSPSSFSEWPDTWIAGDYRVRMALLGVVPLGTQVISISFPAVSDNIRRLRDNGHSNLISRWDHLITIEPLGQGTRYTDRVEIEAGKLTLVCVAFARLFFGHRQRRWKKLARTLTAGRAHPSKT